jgi:putative FmdB family regulatory protein
MPIFEYSCKKCNHQFERLVLGSDEQMPECPKCHGNHVEKLMSAASIRAHGIPTGSGGFSEPACKPSRG